MHLIPPHLYKYGGNAQSEQGWIQLGQPPRNPYFQPFRGGCPQKFATLRGGFIYLSLGGEDNSEQRRGKCIHLSISPFKALRRRSRASQAAPRRLSGSGRTPRTARRASRKMARQSEAAIFQQRHEPKGVPGPASRWSFCRTSSTQMSRSRVTFVTLPATPRPVPSKKRQRFILCNSYRGGFAPLKLLRPCCARFLALLVGQPDRCATGESRGSPTARGICACFNAPPRNSRFAVPHRF